jgi:hypothetical protein
MNGYCCMLRGRRNEMVWMGWQRRSAGVPALDGHPRQVMVVLGNHYNEISRTNHSMDYREAKKDQCRQRLALLY